MGGIDEEREVQSVPVMQQLIPMINKLQDVFQAIGENPIDLPQIVVIGSQSSGKSSVLESIVGRDFLPRSANVCTRRPLVLQLNNTGGEGNSADEWGEFLHLNGQRFTDFADIRTEIERETNRVTGTNKGISSVPISLRIYSPHVLNLTLVDLPGITRVPVGDQPKDIEKRIREMCLKFIVNPHSIILAVTAANTDITNSDALQLAQLVDPESLRTIGVLTKLDLMDNGTDASDILTGRVLPLRRGYVGVVNRSQQDILNNIPMSEARAKEASFFRKHPSYRQLSSRMGTAFLAKNLNEVLVQHIKDCLPDIKIRITTMMLDIKAELSSLGTSMLMIDRAEQGRVMLNVLSKFATDFSNAIEGRSTGSSRGGAQRMLNDLYGGARISYIFNEIFGKTVREIDHFTGLTDEDIRTAIRNATGPRPSLFVPEVSFETLVRRQIALLEQPGLQCVEMVYDELNRLTSLCESADLFRFADLRDRVVDTVHLMLRQRLPPTQTMVSDLIKVEMAYINTNHPDFIGGSKAVARLMERMQAEKLAGKRKKLEADEEAKEQQRRLQQAQQSMSGSTGIMPHQMPGALGVAAAAAAAKQQQRQQEAFQDPLGALPSPPNGNSGSVKVRDDGLMSFLFDGKDTHSEEDISEESASNIAAAAQNVEQQDKKIQKKKQKVQSRMQFKESSNKITLAAPPKSIRQSGGASDREMIEMEIIKSLVASYFDCVRKNFMDLVPKAVMYHLVNFARENIQSELVRNLYKDEIFDDVLRENEDVALRRKHATEMQSLLQQALVIVNETRDFNVFK